jgi:hypothetical protein
MRATLETRNDGALALLMDGEAARAVFASVLFAARLHEGISPLATVAQLGLQLATGKSPKGKLPCQ